MQITPKFIKIGKGVVIREYARVEGITKYAGENFFPKIEFGENVKIQQSLHLTCAKKVFVGKETAIAANVTITDINHGYEILDIPPERQKINVQEVYIGMNCKIYNNAVILPGTILGKQVIVGANSVVKGVFPDYCVIAGAPAKIIKRYNFTNKQWEKTNFNGDFIL
ncbi:hypothetical protein I5M32_14100 [Pedobacter sp. SD-b]|uniref:Acyltransferase n=1 Tax=Pedobacter segetis TaxID=2793069 RepID=A0ABS1BMQ5_9SPHI|nr:hypothetical protein [Pedobacter segetis]MBK0384098.1 hypothetical protein [Pedobacter segetis]